MSERTLGLFIFYDENNPKEKILKNKRRSELSIKNLLIINIRDGIIYIDNKINAFLW